MNINKQRQIDIESIPNLTLRVEMLSNEGIGDVFKKITNIFTSKTSEIANYFTKKNKSLKEINLSARPLAKLSKDVNAITKKISFSTYKDYEVGSIMGLRTNLLDATNNIEIALNNANNNLLESLDTLDTTISKIISDKDYIKSLRAAPYPKLDNNLISEIMDNIIDANSRNDQFKLGMLYPNVKSIYDTHSKLLAISRLVNQKDLEVVSETIEKIAYKVNTLKEQIDKGIITKASKNVILGLADSLEINAKYITNVIAVYHILNIVNETHIKAVRILKALSK